MNNNIRNVRIDICLGEHHTMVGVKKTTVVGCYHPNVASVYVEEAAVARAAKRLGGNVADVRYFNSPAVVKICPHNEGANIEMKSAWKLA